jgi:hypothetical protein
LLHLMEDSALFDDLCWDILVLMKDGVLPPKLTQQLLAEIREKKNIDTSGLLDWKTREILSDAMRKNLHVVVSASSEKMLANHEVFERIFDYVMIDHLDYWNELDLASFTRATMEESEEFKQNHLEIFVSYAMEIYTRYKHMVDHHRLIHFVKTFCHVVRLKRINLELLEKRYTQRLLKLKKSF